MPIGQKICDMCGGPPATAAAKWRAPLEAAPVQLASSAAGWSQPQAPPPQAADLGIAVPSYVTVGSLRAPFWMRAIALLIDGAVVGIPSYALSVVVLQQPGVGPRYAIGVLLNLIYFVYFWSGPDFGCPDPHPDTDETALREGYITVTPLHFNLTHAVLLAKMKDWEWTL